MDIKTTNPYKEDWQKEIDNKNFEELAKIIANKDNYSVPFIELVEQKIKTLSDYNEDKLNEIIESERLERQKREEDAMRQMSIWQMFFMVGLVLAFFISIFNAVSALSLEKYAYNFPIMCFDITKALGLSVLAGYTFISLYKCWSNAIYLIRFYIGLTFILYTLYFIFDIIPLPRLFIGIVVGGVWYLYFTYSERVQLRYPAENWEFLKRDKYILGATIIIPIIFLVWGLSYTPTTPPLSVADGMDIAEVDTSSYFIDKSKLEENEITDGIVIIKVPKGIYYKEIDLGDGVKCYDLSNNQVSPDYVIRVIGQGYVNSEDVVYGNLWEQFQDSTLMDLPHERIKNDMEEMGEVKCYRTIMKYKSDVDLFWDFTLLYDNELKKACLLNSYYNEDNKAPVQEIIDGIKFR